MMKKKGSIREIVWGITIILGMGIIILIGSYLVYRTTIPEGLSISEDGYIEIYTASDYEKFWQLAGDPVAFEPVNGRLMADIHLNSMENFYDWISQPPENQCSEVHTFSGKFDGNGHTIYGLYSENGYGIAKRNRGEIYNLTIRDSLIIGNRYVGGICSYNNSLIRNCRFEGEIRSNRVNADAKCKMAGISVVNDGRIEACGYEGVMSVRMKWTRLGQRAGICTENYGEIVNCYNLVPEIVVKDGNCYGIADTGEENCYILKHSGWQLSDSGQVWEIPNKEKESVEAYLNRDVYALYQAKEAPGSWYEKGKKNKKKSFEGLADVSPGEYQEASGKGLYDGEFKEITIKAALQDELVSDFIFEAFLRREMDIPDLTIKGTGTEQEEVLFDVETGWKGEQLRIASCLWDGDIELKENGAYTYEKIWNDCSRILGEENGLSWNHDTWSILEKGPGNDIKGVMVLYSTKSGEQGFFYVTEGKIYRIEYDGMMQEEQFLSVKNRIEEYAFIIMEEEDTEGSAEEDTDTESLQEENSIDERQYASLWETMLWQIWAGSIPGDGFSWKDENLRDVVYTEAAVQASLDSDGKILSREELAKVESLEIHDAGIIYTLEDLAHLEGLKSLTIQDTELRNTKFIEEMPQLTELYLINCGLNDISFARNLTNLTHASFYGNAIRDISALAYCKKLEQLSLANCQVQDISALAFNTGLKELGLQENEITDIEALRNLENLTALNLVSNNVRDISPLAELTNLTALGLADNRIQDISALSGLEELYNLSLDANEIQDIGALKNMTEMEWLGLSNNQIQDFTPVKNYKNLFYLSVYNNPIQNIGNLMFTPDLRIGNFNAHGMEEMEQAQKLLNQVSPGQVILAEDVAKGDLNRDGIEDMAVTGISEQEKDEEGCIVDWGERNVYVFLGDREGNLQLIDSLETSGPDEGGIYGDPYQGIAFAEKYLLIQNYGGSNFRWADTDIYQYENGGLSKNCRLVLNNWLGNDDGYKWSVYDEKTKAWKHYAVSGQLEKSVTKLLISDGTQSDSENAMKKEISDTVLAIEQEKGIELPEITDYFYEPDIDGDGYYFYEVHDTLYEVKEEPAEVLEKVKTKYMDEAWAMPMTQYTTKEIKDNYDSLSGVVLPDIFYLGFKEETSRMLIYEGCMETAEEGYVHMLTIKEPTSNNGWWLDNIIIYYYENTGIMEER